MPRRRTQQPSLKPAPTNKMTLLSPLGISYAPESGGVFMGTEDQVNALLSAMGYAQIAIRRNLMSGTHFIEAKDTPLFCSPSSETYWSM